MKLRRFFQSLMTVVAMTTAMTLTSFAGIKDAGFLTSDKNGYVFKSISGSDISGNYVQAEKVLNTACPAVGMTTLDKVYSTDTGSILISSESAEKLDAIQNQVDSWIADNIRNIVPQGTPVADIPYVAANWVADRMSYDRAAIGDSELARSYQSALRCFTDGKGICATYSYAFNSIVSAVPAANGIVDYNASNPSYLVARFVYNNDHAWSAVNDNGIWRYYDVCNYDANRNVSYLNMSPDTMNAGGYGNIKVAF
ncbi:MAG: hypothetical protein K5760_02510 [Clostridium sp.]|nr:hypothetical protein [Clostridium sp.]